MSHSFLFRDPILSREIHLSDGRRLLRADRFDQIMAKQSLTPLAMNERNSFRIHPSFRIVALASPPTRENPWCTSELLAIFPFVDVMAPLAFEEKLQIITSLIPIQEAISPNKQQLGKSLLSLLSSTYNELQRMESNSSNEIKLSASLTETSFVPSTRQLLRLWKGACEALNSLEICDHPNQLILENIKERIRRMFMVPFMPQTLRETFETSLARVQPEESSNLSMNIANHNENVQEPSSLKDLHIGQQVRIGNVSLPLNVPERPELVPDTLFVEIPAHIRYLESISHDILAKERHILLIGNQGFLSPSPPPPSRPCSAAQIRNWEK
jgi:von Willebrand factor A domain-containing protein 8